jgi:hypothetical protein
MFATIETVEYPVKLFCGNTRSVVHHFEAEMVCVTGVVP